jgi:M-phase inducer tyrosine phosphatase
MDIIPSSPLPHKPAFGSTFEIQLQSPTPELTPADSSSLSIPSPPLDTPLEPAKLSLPQECVFQNVSTPTTVLMIVDRRRKPGPFRPGLARPKGYSTGCVPQKPSAESRLPPFKFGSGMSKLTTSSSMTLSEIFIESPVQDRLLAPANTMMGPPRPRQPLAGLAGNIRNGSPVSGHVRKNSNPLVRPRKQFRRSLSMFEHPEDVMKQEQSTCNGTTLPSIMDIEPEHIPQLPHFVLDDRPGDLPRISKETLIGVLDGNFNQHYEKLLVIDCRFEYEYNGGHINGAVNFNDKEELSSQLFDVEPTSKALLIFHCEYSAHRAPIMAKFIRNKDRAVNAERYPGLTYPELYILDGGYSSFFKDYRPRCFPQNYVEMEAASERSSSVRNWCELRLLLSVSIHHLWTPVPQLRVVPVLK